MNTRWLIAALLLLAGQISTAAEVTLFVRAGQFVSGYGQKVRDLKAGDTVIFSDGTKFTIVNVLGHGGNSAVFETSGGMALKVPRNATSVSQIVFNDFVDGYATLRAIPGISVTIERSLAGEYALVSNVEKPNVSLEELLQKPELRAKFGEERIWSELKKFLTTLAPLAAVADFKPEQVLYNEKTKFKLVDWQSYHETARSVVASTILDDRTWRGRLPTALVEDVRGEITKIRRDAKLPESEPPGFVCRVLNRLSSIWRLARIR